MENTIDILKEILYHTEVGEDTRYAEAIIDAIHKLQDIKDEPLVPLLSLTSEFYESVHHILQEVKEACPDESYVDFTDIDLKVAECTDAMQYKYEHKEV